uniref:Uncharacterized protein n=1 Tax=Oryza rufipogon TaxID=4529 RepID=A0A0E0RJT3_ORYRU
MEGAEVEGEGKGKHWMEDDKVGHVSYSPSSLTKRHSALCSSSRTPRPSRYGGTPSISTSRGQPRFPRRRYVLLPPGSLAESPPLLDRICLAHGHSGGVALTSASLVEPFLVEEQHNSPSQDMQPRLVPEAHLDVLVEDKCAKNQLNREKVQFQQRTGSRSYIAHAYVVQRGLALYSAFAALVLHCIGIAICHSVVAYLYSAKQGQQEVAKL